MKLFLAAVMKPWAKAKERRMVVTLCASAMRMMVVEKSLIRRKGRLGGLSEVLA